MPSPSWTCLPAHPTPLNLPFFYEDCSMWFEATKYIIPHFQSGRIWIILRNFYGIKKNASKILVSKIHIWEEKGKCLSITCEKNTIKPSQSSSQLFLCPTIDTELPNMCSRKKSDFSLWKWSIYFKVSWLCQ